MKCRCFIAMLKKKGQKTKRVKGRRTREDGEGKKKRREEGKTTKARCQREEGKTAKGRRVDGKRKKKGKT